MARAEGRRRAMQRPPRPRLRLGPRVSVIPLTTRQAIRQGRVRPMKKTVAVDRPIRGVFFQPVGKLQVVETDVEGFFTASDLEKNAFNR